MREGGKREHTVLILGGGAAGLFAAASMKPPGGGALVFNTPEPGRKLLRTGGGRCNLTGEGEVKNYLRRYGKRGKELRRLLYSFPPGAVRDFFGNLGVETQEDEAGRVLPRDGKASSVLEALVRQARSNGFRFYPSFQVREIRREEEGYALLAEDGRSLWGSRLLVAAGGASWPETGSDGSLFPILEGLGLPLVPLRPALASIQVEGYPFSSLAGITLKEAEGRLGPGEARGSLLLTHRGFSGPLALNLSRYGEKGAVFTLSYLGKGNRELLLASLKEGKSRGGLLRRLLEEVLGTMAPGLPRRFLEAQWQRQGLLPDLPAGAASRKDLEGLADRFARDAFLFQGTSGFHQAMATAGGVALAGVDMKTMEARGLPGFYLAGEVLDVDGDTGGYNLQFAWSSAHQAAASIMDSFGYGALDMKKGAGTWQQD